MVTITLKEFPTHVAYTDNKYAVNKMKKLNNQSIYNGALNRFSRAIVMKNLHNYVTSNIPKGLKITSFPVKIHYLFRTVRNHGSISMRKGKICWKPAKEGYEANWDLQNLAMIWMKGADDAFSKAGVLPDDNVDYIKGESFDIEFVDTLEERELIITFEKWKD
tara:strand:+ start:107 stop:595 length:489 start_codon:yes stop_codon:yes gene_type:complete